VFYRAAFYTTVTNAYKTGAFSTSTLYHFDVQSFLEVLRGAPPVSGAWSTTYGRLNWTIREHAAVDTALNGRLVADLYVDCTGSNAC